MGLTRKNYKATSRDGDTYVPFPSLSDFTVGRLESFIFLDDDVAGNCHVPKYVPIGFKMCHHLISVPFVDLTN